MTLSCCMHSSVCILGVFQPDDTAVFYCCEWVWVAANRSYGSLWMGVSGRTDINRSVYFLRCWELFCFCFCFCLGFWFCERAAVTVLLEGLFLTLKVWRAGLWGVVLCLYWNQCCTLLYLFHYVPLTQHFWPSTLDPVLHHGRSSARACSNGPPSTSGSGCISSTSVQSAQEMNRNSVL